VYKRQVDDHLVQIGLERGNHTLYDSENDGQNHPMLLEFGQRQNAFKEGPLGSGFIRSFRLHELGDKITLKP
jgi:hypothetical protein